ncbi:MAG: CinA family nicotinamide mononucleotide deamidase-related protein [Alphaproteobacteria bacterium]|nr:CinA family nicotinamide mononucleotide deamidase-related protein [Alphaproteobacteria bacterium]
MRIEILCTGDEILTGKTINTNYSHIAQRLGEAGLTAYWGTTVGDDRDSLLAAFRQAAARADAVIVNGGLGPTVDDLSQEVAAAAAGVELVLNAGWLARMEEYYGRRGRVMPATNRKQAMLPAGANMIDNPIGTACGFSLTIGRARFYFTPGVPREMRRMLDEQLIPSLLALGGVQGVTRLKRFHSFGIGESRADQVLAGIEALAPGSEVKLGFQAHYPQLETKLMARGTNAADLERSLAPIEAELRRRLGNFIVAEDDRTLEGVILAALRAQSGTLAIAETFTGGSIASRLASLDGAELLFRRGVVARDPAQLCAAVGLDTDAVASGVSGALAAKVAAALRSNSGASHGLAVLVNLDEGADRLEFGGTICIGIADAKASVVRQARMLGGRDWVRRGATELGLDCLRRHLLGLPVDEQIDFEKR